MNRRQFTVGSAALLAALPFARAVEPSPNFPPPLPFAPDPRQRARLTRSLTLLATSTPQRRNRVRVLFYGQSITEQDWWKSVAAHLRTTYPHADLVIENRAIGGHAAQLLVKTAEADLYPFQPDLLFFHVYGHHERYEDIIRRVRERTVADILLQTDHLTKPEDLTEETNPAKLTPKQWSAWMNQVQLPAVAEKYGACRADIHTLWKRYLKDSQLEPAALLKDGVHLNAHGCFVMAELLKPYLDPPESPAAFDPFDCPRVRTVPVPAANSALEVGFTGSRIDAVTTGPGEPVEISIDGRPPSAWAEAHGFTRVSAFPQSNWPILLQVRSEAALVAEEWSLTLHDLDETLTGGRFTVRGSVTGDDGEGKLGERFVSRSRRVVIESDDWNLKFCHDVFHRGLPDGHVVSWKAELRGTDRFRPMTAGVETWVSGLPDGPHRLRLGGRAGISALHVYSPKG